MAGVFSDVDFNRMQTQLLELREASYKSDEKCRKQEKELTNVKEQLTVLEKELLKANQVINKSKKAKEYEFAINEIDLLQRKLQRHEEDSRLQTETLMRELSQLVGVNEKLEKDLKEKDEGNTDKVSRELHQALQDDLRRLQAQYLALQKCRRTHLEVSVTSNEDTESTNNDNNGDVTSRNNNEVNDTTSQSTEKAITEDQNLQDLQLTLTIEREENVLLKQQLSQLGSKHKEEMIPLKQEVDKLSEKVKKKQESLLQLQDAKDQLFKDMSDKLSAAEVEQKKSVEDSEAKFIQESQSWVSSKKSLEEELNKLRKRFLEIDYENKQLEDRLTTQGQESTQNLNDFRLDFELKFKKQIETIHNQKEKIENLKTQLKESQSAHHQIIEEMMELKNNRDIQAACYQEAAKLAEKRKTLLDQLAMKYQEDSDQHRDQIRDQQSKQDSIVNDLNLELSQLKMQIKDLKSVEGESEILKDQLKSFESAKNCLERNLQDMEEKLEQTREENNANISQTTSYYKNELLKFQQSHDNQLQELEQVIISKDSEIENLKEFVKKYEQVIKDHDDDKKLHERRGSTVIKDLRKQLHSERKRAEKLQEKLQEIISDSKNRQSVEDLFRPIEDRLKFADNSSLSSWSPSGLSRDNITSQCSFQGTDEESDTTLKQENEELIRKSGDLMQKVAVLNEKVSHLESSNAAMADDLIEKTAVIDHYHMDSKAGQSASPHSNNDKLSSLKRVVDFVIDKNDNKRDMNKKLQRILEETLTKNMHLQNDMERLSMELSDLRTGKEKS